MKCEICNYQQSPSNLAALQNQVQTCSNDLCKSGSIIWRDGEMTLALQVNPGETVFVSSIETIAPAPVPLAENDPRVIKPMISSFGSIGNAKTGKERNDDRT
jgi:hypothetical protein